MAFTTSSLPRHHDPTEPLRLQLFIPSHCNQIHISRNAMERLAKFYLLIFVGRLGKNGASNWFDNICQSHRLFSSSVVPTGIYYVTDYMTARVRQKQCRFIFRPDRGGRRLDRGELVTYRGEQLFGNSEWFDRFVESNKTIRPRRSSSAGRGPTKRSPSRRRRRRGSRSGTIAPHR